jgi:hypothetical protein
MRRRKLRRMRALGKWCQFVQIYARSPSHAIILEGRENKGICNFEAWMVIPGFGAEPVHVRYFDSDLC